MSSCEEPAGEEKGALQERSPILPLTSVPLNSTFLAAANVSPDTIRHFGKGLPTKELASREELVSFARQFLGTPYVYAGNDPGKGFDCSGFIYYVYQHYKIPVPRSSIDFKNWGREVSLSEAKIADLILFTGATDTDRIGHIGIVLQAGTDTTHFIHASSGTEMAVTISSAAAPHYRKRFVKVVDVIPK
jgi:cell wall-associated NlpC family hydrolase